VYAVDASLQAISTVLQSLTFGSSGAALSWYFVSSGRKMRPPTRAVIVVDLVCFDCLMIFAEMVSTSESFYDRLCTHFLWPDGTLVATSNPTIALSSSSGATIKTSDVQNTLLNATMVPHLFFFTTLRFTSLDVVWLSHPRFGCLVFHPDITRVQYRLGCWQAMILLSLITPTTQASRSFSPTWLLLTEINGSCHVKRTTPRLCHGRW
jgi:hypothetical protein